MVWLKRIMRSHLAHATLCAMAAFHIWLVYATGRWKVVGEATPRRFWDEGKPFILCFWHGRGLMLPYCWRRSMSINMLISHHRDGRIIAHIVRYFGIDTIAGSSSRGGGTALRAMVRSLRSGTCIGITPDGPQGPRMHASAGVITVARLAEVPIIPVAFSTSRRSVLDTWDRFILAWPWGRGVFVWGEPIWVAPQADASAHENARRDLEGRLNEVTREADRLCRQPEIAPAPSAPASAAGKDLGQTPLDIAGGHG